MIVPVGGMSFAAAETCTMERLDQSSSTVTRTRACNKCLELVMLCIGMMSALLGGWLGAWLFGPQYATSTALWVGVVGVCIVPRFFMGRKVRGVSPS